MTKRCLVTIPAYGDDALTQAVVPDVLAESDLVDLLIIDNSGHYEPRWGEWVIRPKTNIGWARASNFGFRIAFSRGYGYAVTLNNDTRLSPGFFAGLLDERLPDDAGLVAPMYDDHGTLPAQTSDFTGAACDYRPSDYCQRVPAVDGTAMMMSAEAWQTVGELDYRSFGKFNWGSDLDLSIRVREAGFGVYITERSFLNHQRKASASATVGERKYFVTAYTGWLRGMRRLHGSHSIKETKSTPPVRIPLNGDSDPSRSQSTLQRVR